MKELVLLLSFAVIFKSVSFAETYYSVNDGNWRTSNNVWSTNGIDPCHCGPSYDISADTIIIQNTVTFEEHLIIQKAGELRIASGAALINPLLNITVRNGHLFSNGMVTTSGLNIEEKGLAEFFSSVLNIEGQMNINGSFTANFSNIFITKGNIEIGRSGKFDLMNHAKILFNLGNFNNSGSVDLGENCCIQLLAGNFKNNATGTLSGNGITIADDGNIINEGFWEATLTWCSSGTTFGLSNDENCLEAYENCKLAPLSAELLSFNLVQQNGSYFINWYTFAEEMGEYYLLDRSKDGNNWENLGQLEARNPGGEVTHYVFIDDDPISGISYYRITLYTSDGGIGFTAILGVDSRNLDEVIVFPNPTTDHITVRFSRPLENVAITITDASGNTIELYNGDTMIEETFHLPFPCGMYFVRIESDAFNEVIKVIKK